MTFFNNFVPGFCVKIILCQDWNHGLYTNNFFTNKSLFKTCSRLYQNRYILWWWIWQIKLTKRMWFSPTLTAVMWCHNVFRCKKEMWINCCKAMGTRTLLTIYICGVFTYGLISALRHTVFATRYVPPHQRPTSNHTAKELLHKDEPISSQNDTNTLLHEYWAVLLFS